MKNYEMQMISDYIYDREIIDENEFKSYYINRFYEEFTRDEIVQHPVAQISWRSIILIMKFSTNLVD